MLDFLLQQNKVLKYIGKSMNNDPRRKRRNAFADSAPSSQRYNQRRVAVAVNDLPISTKRSSKSRSTNATLMISLMTSSFYLCWTPYALRCILGMLGFDLNAELSGVSILISKLGVIINPVLYIFYNKEVRADIFYTSFRIFCFKSSSFI